MLALQRSAGNRAVSAALGAAKDTAAEAEADRVAAQAASTLDDGEAEQARASIRAGGSRLPVELQAALRPHVGPTSSVTLDTSAESAHAADALQARAFADGSSIHLGPGELSSPDAAGLVLHEAAHAARHQPVDAGGRHLVHAKLRGTRDAVVAQGGGSTSGMGRKLLSKIKVVKVTNWDRILKDLAVYEAAEGALLAHGNPSQGAVAAATPKMLTLLGRIEASCRAWQAANGGDAGNKQPAEKDIKKDDEDKELDSRTKVARRQAVAMLLPRVGGEMTELRRGTWASGLGLTDRSRTGGTDKADKGQVNSVDEVIYNIAGTSFTGYFKADKGFENSAPGHQGQVGITNVDPNYGGRSVAMHRLDQLLGTDVIARSEFAVHNNKMGAVTEKAKGTRASDINIKITQAERDRAGGDAISAEDPVLQRGLNKLQIIDAIAGQLDRHVGNYFIQTDRAGNVTGVTGIDLDMAFGDQMLDPSIQAKPGSAAHYRGLPALVDHELGQRLLLITPEQVEAAITGLLSPAEVAATKERYKAVRAHAQALADSGNLTTNWGAGTASEGRAAKPSKFSFQFSDITSYTNVLVDEAAGSEKLERPVSKAVQVVLDDWVQVQTDDLPEITIKSIPSVCAPAVTERVVIDAYRGAVGVDQAVRQALTLAGALLGEPSLTRLVIGAQENDLKPVVMAEMDRLLQQGLAIGVQG